MTPLLFIHAFPFDASMWDVQAASLAEDVDRIIAPSLPGFGGTPVPAAQPTLDDYADALVARLDAGGVDRAVVVGLSMGGYVALALWRRHRRRIAGLLLADTRAEADDDAARERRLKLAELVRARGTDALLLQPPKWVRDGSERWEAVRAMVRRQPAEAIAQGSIAMAHRADSTDLLPTIDVPTSVVVGEDDAITPVALSRTMADRIPGATLTTVARAGHLSNMDAPDEFDRALRDLVRRVADR
ncbi:MAG TPA: alpha/beta fold hydrolase [Candidatus Limnocylindria bacterium]